MQTSIINELNTNYLIIASNEFVTTDFEEKMFRYNDIKGFLSFETSRVNNNITYQYNISAYENMEKAFYNKEFGYKDVKNIFTSIANACQRAFEYLLNADGILLNPEYIFMNGEEFLFCYYPSGEITFNKGIRELMEYILERLDHKDNQNVMKTYGLYQKILKNNFTIDSLMEEFETVEEAYIVEHIKPSEKFLTESEIKVVNETNDKILETSKTLRVENKNEVLDIEQLEKELELEVKNNKKISWFDKTSKSKKTSANKDEKIKSIKQQDSKKKFKLFEKKSYKIGNYESPKTMLLAESTQYNSTQLLSGKRLINQGNGKDIMLNPLPLRIGSKKEDCDCCIDNIMVSRNHAVLSYECGNYYIEDNDSTNGTFVNGSRISPYEPVLIREGDTVSFANEKYRLN